MGGGGSQISLGKGRRGAAKGTADDRFQPYGRSVTDSLRTAPDSRISVPGEELGGGSLGDRTSNIPVNAESIASRADFQIHSAAVQNVSRARTRSPVTSPDAAGPQSTAAGAAIAT